MLHAVARAGLHLVLAFAGVQFQTHPFGRMRHGAGQHCLGEACPSLRQRRCHRIDQPGFQIPDAADTALGKPPPTPEQRVQVDLERHPLEQIFHGGDKFLAFVCSLDVVARKMQIAPTTGELPPGIAKTEQFIRTGQHVEDIRTIRQ